MEAALGRSWSPNAKTGSSSSRYRMVLASGNSTADMTNGAGTSFGVRESETQVSSPVRTIERLPLRLGKDSNSCVRSGFSARSEL